jgi:RHS repeat-associated protein
MTWDFDNRLQQATVGGTTTSFTYDALGRRVTKSSGGATTVFVSTLRSNTNAAAADEVAEYTLGATPGNPLRKYVGGDSLDTPLLLDTSGTLYYYHGNSNGDVVAVTSQSGAVAELYAYTAFGGPTILAPNGTTVLTASAIGNSFMFTGRRLDPETGLYHFRARYYDSQLGRFLGRDPVGTGVSFLNLYAYVHNSPYGHTDPLGLEEARGENGGFQNPHGFDFQDCPGPLQLYELWLEVMEEWQNDDDVQTYVVNSLRNRGCIGITSLMLGHSPDVSGCFRARSTISYRYYQKSLGRIW